MKQYLVIVLSFALISQSQCGLIDGLIGKVKDTTSSIKEGIGGALHYGKNLVFGGSEADETGRTVTKPGIIGTMSLKIHDVAQVVRTEVINVFSMFDKNQAQEGTEGVVAKIFNKVKNRIIKVKSFLFGNGLAQIENNQNAPIKLSNDTSLLCEKLRKYFFKHNLSESESGFKKTMFSFQDIINRIRNNITSHKNYSGNEKVDEEDGAGMIDIRTSVNGMGDDFVSGIDAGYDKIEDGINEERGKAKDSTDTLKQSTNNFIENQRNRLQNNFEKFGNKASDVGTRLRDESYKVKDGMENAYNKVDFELKQSLGKGS